MKAVINFLFFICLITHVAAQTVRINDDNLIGVWEYKSDLAGVDSNAFNYKKHSISEYTFLPTGEFKFRYFKINKNNLDTCLNTIVEGKWELKNNELKLKYKVHEGITFFGGHQLKMQEWSSEQIIQAGRDSLVVFLQSNYAEGGDWYETGETIYYKRLKSPIYVANASNEGCIGEFYNLIEIPNIDSLIVINFGNKYLVNSLDSTKIIQIPTDRNIEIYYEEKLTDSIYDSKSFNGLGYLDSIYEDSILVNLYEVNEELWLEDNLDWISTSTSIIRNPETSLLYTIDLYNLPTLGFSTNANDVFQSISAIGIFSGFLTALVIAPLVSINYKTGDFRDHRYYSVAGYSLAAVAVSLPIYFLSFPKSYILIPKGGEIDQDHWYLSN